MSAEKWTLILSIIGAAAWIPPIITWLFKQTIKASVKIFPESSMRIVENEHNVVLHLKIGLLVRKKNVFIEKMTLRLTHEEGESRLFVWGHISEAVSTTLMNEISMPTSKNLQAIGYNILKDTYVEPLFSFYNPVFREKHEELSDRLGKKSFQFTSNKISKKELEKLDEWAEKENNYRNHYSWKAGKYACVIKVHILGNRVFERGFKFQIDNGTSEMFLKGNLAIVLDKMKNLFTRDESEKVDYDEQWLNKGMPFKISIDK